MQGMLANMLLCSAMTASKAIPSSISHLSTHSAHCIAQSKESPAGQPLVRHRVPCPLFLHRPVTRLRCPGTDRSGRPSATPGGAPWLSRKLALGIANHGFKFRNPAVLPSPKSAGQNLVLKTWHIPTCWLLNSSLETLRACNTRNEPAPEE